jgi:large subunit ribosomal protein L10
VAKILKQLLASQVAAAVKDADGAVFVNVAPMTVEVSTRFRDFLVKKAGGARLRIVHNRTAKKALETAGWPAKVSGVLRGPTAIIFGGDGPAVIAKSLTEWVRQDKTLVVKGAVAEGEFYDAKGVTQTLARMPDKRTLRAMILSGVLAPGRGLATAVAAPGASIARALKARIDKNGFAPDA